VIFLYKETRKQDNPHEFLKDFKGFVHTDGYQAYHNLPSDITVVGCWVHARRYWENLLKTIPENNRKGTDAERGVASITKLFMLEREFQKLQPEERYQERLKKVSRFLMLSLSGLKPSTLCQNQNLEKLPLTQ